MYAYIAWTVHTHTQKYEYIYLQHSMGFDATCNDTVLPVAWLMWTRKTILTRVFLRPISVSPFRSSMSELRSLRIPAQSILWDDTKSLNYALLSFKLLYTRWAQTASDIKVDCDLHIQEIPEGESLTLCERLKEAEVMSTED